MARKKKSMIGFDPLAWLDDDVVSDAGVKETKPEQSPAEKEKIVNVLGQSLDVTSLIKGYELINDSLEDVIADFYAELFSQHPGVVPLFENTDAAGRARKLSSAIKLLFDNFEDEAALKNVLHDLGERHQAYGAEAGHYDVVANLLIATCKKHVGRSWTKAITTAWENLFSGVAETMMAAYKETAPVKQQVESVSAQQNSKQAETSEKDDVLLLDNVQDISKSELLKKKMLELVKQTKHIKIDASDVGRVDGSALQLLCGLFEYAGANGIQLSWINPSEAMVSSAEYMGLKEQLSLN